MSPVRTRLATPENWSVLVFGNCIEKSEADAFLVNAADEVEGNVSVFFSDSKKQLTLGGILFASRILNP